MVDAPNNLDPNPSPAPAGAGKPGGFLGSTTGNLILGGIALFAVLVVVGLIAWTFFFSGANPGSTAPSTSAGQQAASAVTSSSPAQTAPIVEPQEKPLESTFTFRNVFAPTMKAPAPPPPPTTETAASSSSSATVEVPANTLFLESIQTENGEKTATFIWNGATYKLSEGDTISGTPWKLVEINGDSVVMLFGDSQVTLSTGQGITK